MERSLPTRRSRALLGLVAASMLTACTENKGTAGASAVTDVKASAVALVNDAVGPAAPVADAKPGGTITLLMVADFEHLDPAQNYVNVQQIVAELFQRTLTVFRDHPDGSFDLVGDLATNTGVTTDGGLTWTFTLRDGLKYEDGSPITSQDVA